MLKCCHPELELIEPAGLPYGRTYHGHHGLGQLVAAVAELYEFEIRSVEAHDWGDNAVGYLEATFVSRATGKRLDTHVVEIYTFTEGLLSSVETFPHD